MKSGFFINIKYGIISYRYQIAILVVLTFFMGLVMAYNNSVSFHNWYIWYIHNNTNPSQSDINLAKIGSVYSFWYNLNPIIMIFIVPLASFLTSKDEENDMNKYLLLYRITRSSLYFSKVMIMSFSSFIVSLIIWLTYGFLFSSITGFSVWNAGVFLAIFMLYFIVALLGAAIGIGIRRKAWGIVVSVFLIIFLIFLGGNIYQQGISNAAGNHNLHTVAAFRSAIPLFYKVVGFMNPSSLTEILHYLLGIPQTMDNPYNLSVLGFMGDVYVYITWIVVLISVGYIVFFLRHRGSAEVRA